MTRDHERVSASAARLLVAARVMRVDQQTGEVARAMRERGIRVVLLKGPVIQKWIYGDESIRPYTDSDLLVEEASYGEAEGVLSDLGFQPFSEPPPGTWVMPARAWRRQGERASVDLHRSIEGFGNLAYFWRHHDSLTRTQLVGGEEVRVLSDPLLALHLATHAAQHGAAEVKPMVDLEHGLGVYPSETWQLAASLADQLQATPYFVSGLTLSPIGADLLARLELSAPDPLETRLRRRSASRAAINLEHALREKSLLAGLRHVLRKAFPSRSWMRANAGAASMSTVALAGAYGRRVARLLRELPGALREVWEARRAQR